MDNKQEDKEFVESESGVMDQMVVAPVEGAGVDETKVSDPHQAEPPLGDEDERGGESPTQPSTTQPNHRITTDYSWFEKQLNRFLSFTQANRHSPYL